MKFKKKQDHQYYKITEINDDFEEVFAQKFPLQDDFVLDLTAIKTSKHLFEKIIPSVLTQRKNNHAFVVVCEDVSIADTFEEYEDMDVVPTYNESLDVLELERIKRDLGF